MFVVNFVDFDLQSVRTHAVCLRTTSTQAPRVVLLKSLYIKISRRNFQTIFGHVPTSRHTGTIGKTICTHIMVIYSSVSPGIPPWSKQCQWHTLTSKGGKWLKNWSTQCTLKFQLNTKIHYADTTELNCSWIEFHCRVSSQQCQNYWTCTFKSISSVVSDP